MVLILASGFSSRMARAAEPVPDGREIRIAGSGGPMATIPMLAEAFQKTHPQAHFVIVPSLGTAGGIKALRAGAIDVSLASRKLRPADNIQDLNVTEYARTPFVFAAAGRESLPGVTTAELVRIYNGEQMSWPDGRPLRLVLRPTMDSDTDLLKGMSPEMSLAVQAASSRKGMIVAVTDKDSADSIESVPGSLGSTTLGLIISEKRHFHALALDGVMPSLEALADGTYRHYKVYLVVTGPGSSPMARQFADFLQSPVAREILKKNGHGFGPSR